MGETRVDLLHLLEDLADAYPGELEETVLTEMVANSLDSGASAITLTTDPAGPTLTVTDDGVGMRRAELRRFHDVAASTKTRGDGIGFAGVGIKLGLLASDEVITESRRGKDHIATTWALSQRKRAPWRWIPPLGLVADRGTAVRLVLANALSPLLDAGLLETLLRRHFAPLFDDRFDEVLAAHYPHGVRFQVNGVVLAKRAVAGADRDIAPITIRLARKRKPSAFGYLARESVALSDDMQGVAISTLGKVIKRGWDWLGVAPAAPNRVTGLIEVPALASCLTLNKVEFLRAGPRGATYFAYRKALQEAVSAQLAQWGDAPESDSAHRRAARPVERDVEQVLAELADRFPMLSTLVEHRAGGRKKLPAADSSGDAGSVGPGAMDLFAPPAQLAAETQPNDEYAPTSTPTPAPVPDTPPAQVAPGARTAARRPTRLGLTIQFESRPDDPELGRLVESTVWVNDAHPAYTRAAASRSEGYHIALSVAMALASLAVEPSEEHAFITAFLSGWGESIAGRGPLRKRGKRKGRR